MELEIVMDILILLFLGGILLSLFLPELRKTPEQHKQEWKALFQSLQRKPRQRKKKEQAPRGCMSSLVEILIVGFLLLVALVVCIAASFSS